MPGNRPERGREPRQPASWRGDRKQAGRGPRDYEFRGTKEQELRQRRFRRRMRAGVLTAAALLLVGIWIYWVWRLPVKTPVIALALTSYPAPIPPNAWSLEDQRFWLPPKGESNLLVSPLRGGAGGAAEIDALLSAVHRARPGGPNKDVVLVYLSAHGVVNSAGEPCLLLPPPTGRAPGELWHLDEKSWLSLEKLLVDLSARRPPPRWNWFRRRRETKLVLFLDAHRLGDCWPLGLAENPFAGALKRSVQKLSAADRCPGVYVVSAADEGEVSLTSTRQGRGVFAAYVQLGLQGGAARDRHVTLLGLYNYLRGAVDGWAITARASRQRPVLLPELRPNADFPLAHAVGSPTAPPAGRPPRTAVPWDEVNALWDFLAAHRPWEQSPQAAATRDRWLQWVNLRNQVLRLEQLNVAGQAYRQEAIDLLATSSAMREGLRSPRAPGQVPSLFLTGVWNAEQHQRLTSEAQRLGPFLRKLAEGLPDDKLAEAFAEVRSLSREAWLRAIWEWSQQPDRTADQVRVALARLEGTASWTAGQGSPLWEEELLLKLLFAPRRGELGDYPAGLLPTNVPAAWWQALLACRQQGQQAAAWGDPRVALCVQPAYTQPDQWQREGLDLLFCGDAQALAKCQEAAAGYIQARKLAEQVEAAWLVCDWACADLPWYAQASFQQPETAVAVHSGGTGQTVGWDVWRAFRTAAGRVGDLSRQQRELLRQLDEAAALSLAGESWNEEEPPWRDLRSRAERLWERMTELQARYDAWLSELGEWSAHAMARRVWGEVLALPLGAKRRGEWRARYEKAAEREPEFQTQWRRPRNTPASARGAADSRVMLSVLGLESEAGRAVPMAEAAGLVRTELRKRWQQIWPSRPREAGAREAPHDTAAEARRTLAKAARPVRETVSVWRLSTPLADDPVARQFDFDWHHVLLWHGRRALEDFWLVPDAGQATPAFYRLARRYVEAAESASKLAGGAASALRERLRQADRAAQNLAAISVPSQVQLTDDQTTFALDVAVSLAGDVASAGQAALFAQPLLGSTAESHPAAVPRTPIPVQPGPQSQVNRTLQVEARPAEWVAALFYRGYLKEEPFSAIGPGTALQTTFRPPQVLPATVHVEGEAARDPILVFIFDYSASMNEPAPRNRKRIDYARQAMFDVLAELAQPGRYDVGLWLYGHRVGKDAAGKRHWRVPPEVQARLEQQGIWPNNDVEEVLSPRRLTVQTYAAFEAALAREQGWGLTPLYQAMTQAIETGFPSPQEVGNRPRWLVVVTDGVNEVDKLQGQPDPPRSYTLADVEAALVRDAQRYQQPLRLCVVFCAAKPGDAEKANQYEQLKRLASSSEQGRQFVERPEADQIIGALRDALGLREFVLIEESAGVGQRERGRAPLGGAVTVPPPFASDKRYRVELQNLPQVAPAPIMLLGGEAIRLYAERQGANWSLRHRRYPAAGEDVVLLPAEREHVANPWARPQDPLQPQAFYVAVHDVKRQGAGRRFRVSVQNDDGSRFSPRPAQMLALLRPKPRDGRSSPAGTYFFCDLDVEPGQPVPILGLLAETWPAGVRRAELDLWFRMTQAEPTRELSVGELERDGCELTGDSGQKLLYSAQIKVEPTGGFAVIVQERQPQAAAGDWYPVLIELAGGDLSPPAAVVRRYYPESRSAQHRFVFANVAGADELRPRRLRLITLADFRRGAGGLPAVEIKNLQFEWNE